MKRTGRRGIALLTAGVLACGVGAAAVSAHVEYAGGGPDTLLGHSHVDTLHGGAGCDTIAGRENGDWLYGGYSACDVVRGQDGHADNVNTEDGLGGDAAYGGAGGDDWCYVDPSDGAGVSCERLF